MTASLLVCTVSLRRHRLLPPAGAVEAKLLQGLVDFFQGLLAEVGDAQQILRGAVEQIADGEDSFLLQAVRRADGQADFGRAHLEALRHETQMFFFTTERNAGSAHRVPSRMKRVECGSRRPERVLANPSQLFSSRKV